MSMTNRLAVLGILFAALANAGTVAVTYTGFGSGSLGGVVFTDKNYQINITGDNSATFVEYGAIWLPSTSASFSISGVGGGAITETMNAWVCSAPSECAGFSASSLGNMIWSMDSGLGLVGYDWTTNFGPTDIIGTSGIASTQGVGAATALGDLFFTSATRSFVMEAQVSGAAAVPEPGSLALLFCGGVILTTLSRRRV